MRDKQRPTQITTILFRSWASKKSNSNLQKDGGKSGITAELGEFIHQYVRKPEANSTQRPMRAKQIAFFI
jgi:hypothetical protein